MIGEPVRGSILASLDEETALVSPSGCRDLLVLAHLPAIRVPITMRRMDHLPRTVGLQQGVLCGPHHGRRLLRSKVWIPRIYPAHVRVHQAVVMIYVGMGVVLNEIETLLSTAGILHRLAELVEAYIPRTVYHASVPQVRAVVELVELAHGTFLLFRLEID